MELMEWLMDSVKNIAAICLVVAAMECIIDEDGATSSFRMLCGLAVAQAVVRMAIRTALNLF